MKVVGLTGGIGSGKSVVAQALRALGAPVVDADLVAREVVEPGGEALTLIAARWPGAIGPDGRLDRKALAARVFADATEREALEAILHPRIAAASAARLAALAHKGSKVAIYEAALIVENQLYEWMDAVIVVDAPDEARLARVVTRDGAQPADVRARMAAQATREERRAHATWIVDNAGPLEETRAQAAKIWKEIGERWGT